MRTSRTFSVLGVAPATQPLPSVPYYEAASQFLGGRVESCSQYHGSLVANSQLHPLVESLHHAFATHRPISLSPDAIWLTLTQGLAYHVNANAEELRHHFVRHEGKLKLSVRRDDFIKGSPENPWPDVFQEFSALIQNHIGDTHGLIVANFSTTGPVERAVSEIALMDAVQAYFAYEVKTMCGIPSMTLEGTTEDWREILNRAREFRRFGLEWWVTALEPLLNQFVAAANGEIDREFWNSIYKWHGSEGSGREPFVTGWILNFFPYLLPITDSYSSHDQSTGMFRRNPWIARSLSHSSGPSPDMIPRWPSRVPFVWVYRGIEYQMEFIGGLIGIRQDANTLCLSPEIGWAVWEAGAIERKREADIAAREAQLEADRELARKTTAATNFEANQHFELARRLGHRVFDLYRAGISSGITRESVEKIDTGPRLLKIVTEAYQSDGDFQKNWDAVHGEPPGSTHLNWLGMWQRI